MLVLRLISSEAPSPRSKVTKTQDSMVLITASFIVGFVVGFLVFRNNAAKAEKVVQAAKDAAKK